MAFNDTSTPLSLLRTRRSGKPRDMAGPGPSPEQLEAMIGIAARTPDHGKLFPWRFVIVPPAARAALGERLVAILRSEKPDCTARDEEAALQFASQAPALVVVLSAPVVPHKIPAWEQELSAGAACMNLLHAAHAMGFAGAWITGWAAYSDAVRDLFGNAPQKIAGFVFIGTPALPLEERPRPLLSEIVHTWNPGYGPDAWLVYYRSMTALEHEDSPVYLKLRASIAAAILRGQYRAGDQLPSVRALAAEHGANPLTVAKAYQSFQDDGYVEVRRGVGMFVLPGAVEKLRIAERERFLTGYWPRVKEHIALLGLDARELFDRETA